MFKKAASRTHHPTPARSTRFIPGAAAAKRTESVLDEGQSGEQSLVKCASRRTRAGGWDRNFFNIRT
jgi:hypothetical protein